MFGFGSKKENPERKAAREEFETTCRQLRGADEVVQMAVGHAINMANSMFMKTFESVDGFNRIPSSQKFEYIAKLTQAENTFRDEKKDMASSLGFGLFKMWVGMVTARDTELIDAFARELSVFSRKGNLNI
jgi:hypothetical protein